jgi:hypothetical protein
MGTLRCGTQRLSVPGERTRLWVLDIDGDRVMVNAGHAPTNTREQVQLTEIVGSSTCQRQGR